MALIEDDCLVADGWCDAILGAHGSAAGAIGGPIEPGPYRTSLDWAIYFCEYARFMRPFAGRVDVLPGNNISYAKSALGKLDEEVEGERGFYETFANQRLLDAGDTLMAVPEAAVSNINSWPAAHLTAVPFHHGRGYAALRCEHDSRARRVVFAALTPVLPALKTVRIAAEVLRRRRLAVAFIRALPAILLFNTSWAAGECVGYLFGPGGSLRRWR